MGLFPLVGGGGGGSGGGVSGLATADGGTALADDKAVTGDGTTGIQGTSVTIVGGAVSTVTQLTVDNLDLNGNAITAQNANGSIGLVPNGTGAVGIGGTTSAFAGLSNRSGSATQLVIGKADGSQDGGIAWIQDLYLKNDGAFTAKGVFERGTGLVLANDRRLTFNSGSTAGGEGDFGVSRVAPGVGMVDGSTRGDRLGWLQWQGESYLAADATNATAALATTGLSVTVKTGRKYAFKCVLYVSDSVAAEGAQIDFGGGTATATNFRAHVTGFDTALTVNTQLTSLSGVASAGTFTGSGMMEIHGSFEPSANGTFIPRFAQNTHAAGTLTLFRGSHLLMWDLP